MVFIYFVLYGLLGAVTGSFLNVCILRIPENQNFVTGRSHCPACGHILAFYDMVPVLSCISLAAGPGPAFLNRLGGSLLAGGFLALVNLLSRGGVGWGDVKLFAASGLLIGAAPAMTALLMGYVIAGLWYAVPLVLGRIGRKTQVPMAPFFAVSLMVCGLWFRQLILWYLGFFR